MRAARVLFLLIPFAKAFASFLIQLPLAEHPLQDFQRTKRLGTKLVMQILGDVKTPVQPYKVG